MRRGVVLWSFIFYRGRGGRFVAAWLAFFLRGALESGGAVFWGAVAAVYGKRLRGGVWRCDAVFLFCWGRLWGVIFWLVTDMCGKVVEAISRAVVDCVGKKERGPRKEGAF